MILRNPQATTPVGHQRLNLARRRSGHHHRKRPEPHAVEAHQTRPGGHPQEPVGRLFDTHHGIVRQASVGLPGAREPCRRRRGGRHPRGRQHQQTRKPKHRDAAMDKYDHRAKHITGKPWTAMSLLQVPPALPGRGWMLPEWWSQTVDSAQACQSTSGSTAGMAGTGDDRWMNSWKLP